MTDPISIATGVAGLVVSCTRISILLTEYTYAFKDAPKDIQDFAGEIAGLSRILGRLQTMLPAAALDANAAPPSDSLALIKPIDIATEVTSTSTTPASPFSEDYVEDLRKVLESCGEVFQRIEELFKRHIDIPAPPGTTPKIRSGMKQFKNRISWMIFAKDFAKLRAVVEAHKATLNVTLLLLVK